MTVTSLKLYDSKLLLVGGDVAASDDCCCGEGGPAPCTCPYDADTEPAQLTVTWTGDTTGCADCDISRTSPTVVYPTSGWCGFSSRPGGSPAVSVNLDEAGCTGWLVSIDCAHLGLPPAISVYEGFKATGATPAGAYTRTGGDACSTIDNVVVTIP